MRITQLLGKTQWEIPAEADTISHQLLVRTAMISQAKLAEEVEFLASR